MTTSRTRKSTTPAGSKKGTEAPTKGAQPMDPEAVERTAQVGSDGTVDVQPYAPFTERNCWAIDVLVREVADLYPEATHYISERTGRGVGISVTFEGWDAHHENDPGLPQVLTCLSSDERVDLVTAEDDPEGPDGWVNVLIRDNPVTRDKRDPFGLQTAYDILSGSED